MVVEGLRDKKKSQNFKKMVSGCRHDLRWQVHAKDDGMNWSVSSKIDF